MFNRLSDRIFICGDTSKMIATDALHELHRNHIGRIYQVGGEEDVFLRDACRTIGLIYKYVPLENKVPDPLLQDMRETIGYTNILIHSTTEFHATLVAAILDEKLAQHGVDWGTQPDRTVKRYYTRGPNGQLQLIAVRDND